MTVSSTKTYIGAIGDGSTTRFLFDMQTYAASDIQFWEWRASGLEQITGITVVLNSDQENSPGGYVDILTPTVNGVAITIFRILQITQEVNYIAGDAFPSASHEMALDRIVMMIQQQGSATDQAVRTYGGDGAFLTDYDSRKAYVRWEHDGLLTNGWTEADMDARFAMSSHKHTISDVDGLQPALDALVDTNELNASQAAQDAIIATLAPLGWVVRLTEDQTIQGQKTFGTVPHTATEPVSPSGLANKGYVDKVFNSLTGIIFKGTIDLSAGNSALPGSPSNGDRYYVGVGGVVTVSDGSGPPTSQAVAAGDSITWSGADSYWLRTVSVGSSGTAADTAYIPGSNVHLTGGNLQITGDQTEAELVSVKAELTTKAPNTHYHTPSEVGLQNIASDGIGVVITGRAKASTKASAFDHLTRYGETLVTDAPRKMGAGVGLRGTVREIVNDGTTLNINPELGGIQWAVHNGSAFTFTLSDEAKEGDATWSMELLVWVQANTTIVSRSGVAPVDIWTPGGQTALQGGFYVMSLRKIQNLDPPVVMMTYTRMTSVPVPGA